MIQQSLIQDAIDNYATGPSLPAASLTSQTALILEREGEPALNTWWGRFVSENTDSLDQAERMLIAASLSAGQTYHGGGGAEPAWSIRRMA